MPNPNANLILPPENQQAAQRAKDIEAAQGGGQQGQPDRLGTGTDQQWTPKKG